MDELEELVNRVRQLTPEELKHFGAWFASYEAAGCNARDAAWDALAAECNEEIQSGRAQVVAGDDVVRRLGSRL